MNGYKIDFAKNTITMNYKFAAAAAEYGTDEYNLVKNILIDFPQLKKIVKAGREIKTPRPTKRLTYANMEKYMSVFTNDDELLAMFETVKTLSAPLKSPYKYVRDWFVAQFPNYNKAPQFAGKNLFVVPLEAPNVEEYEKKEQLEAA